MIVILICTWENGATVKVSKLLKDTQLVSENKYYASSLLFNTENISTF